MKNNKQTGAREDKVAKAIAARIIFWKRTLAAALNRRFNTYSRKKQKWLLAGYCGIGAFSILISLMLSFGEVPTGTIVNNTAMRPIRSLRDPPQRPNFAPITDSLTIKQQTNGKSTTGRQKSGTP
jgi:hypothetical protein